MRNHVDQAAAIAHVIKASVSTDPPSKAKCVGTSPETCIGACPRHTPSAYATNRAKHRKVRRYEGSKT